MIAVDVEGEAALDPEGVDIVCRRFGKPVGQDYATDLSVARLIGRVQLRNRFIGCQANWTCPITQPGYATDCGVNRISFACASRISLKNSYASLI